MAPQAHQKKKPPTFTHYPALRAKSLKKAWVEKAKIKSKWKAEKRKMGLSRRVPAEGRSDEEEEEEEEEEKNEDEEDTKEESGIAPPAKPPHTTHLKSTRSEAPSTSQAKEQPTPDLDLREMTRKAYSRETLHTYKSDPLNRRGGAHSGRGNSRGGARGRGQPNMKLRMGAMLEKIKREYT
ncbi:hypothetical protein BDP27DRAFT_1324686 [Rhodocollybia butyracea]|uniref:rRNA-processing protein FYV7 n=1 Tax=Rhodocollybia butyracea TaxID=206335 RepID=A0A9P5PV11_9AGAR|nr:hypothetical protein BDP27DRAFT_1324686 [Rhodocollybia butyracea]